MAPAGMTLNSHWLAEDQDVLLEPVEDPRAQLHDLLTWYWRGSRQLLHFFPKAAFAYVGQLRKDRNNDAESALRAARTMWEGSPFRPDRAERDDPYYRLAFRDSDPLDAEFTTVAEAVFAPLLALANPAPAAA